MRKLFTATLLLLLLLCPALAIAAASGYTVTDLGAIPKSDYAPGALALNDCGQVVGGFGHAFLWDKGRAKDLGTLLAQDPSDCQSSIAQAINNRGQVVGTSGSFLPIMLSGQDVRGFLFDGRALRFLTRPGQFDQFDPAAINDRGQIVGEDRHTWRGFFYAGGRVTVLGTLSRLPNGNYSAAQSLNRQGQVAGWSTVSDRHHQGGLAVHAVLWRPHGRSCRARDLGTLPGWKDSFACGINDRGEVAGSVTNFPAGTYGISPGSPAMAFLWRRGKMIILGTLPGAQSSEALGLNSAGAVVGQSGGRAFLYRGGRMLGLNALLRAGSGWVLETATGINAGGQIVGAGRFHGKPHAYLLTPSKAL